MKTMAKMVLLPVIFTALAGFWGCRLSPQNGTVVLGITDAPVDNPDIDGVWIAVGEIQYNLSPEAGESGWRTFTDFTGPKQINLLDYQQGLACTLGELSLPAGQYNQIRFLLDIPEVGAKPRPSPGCFVSFKDETTAPLFVPSGRETGYKAVGSFQVPANGTVQITADFDLHKSLRMTAGGALYLLEPTIRLVVDQQAGAIAGMVDNLLAQAVVLFAYADQTYDSAESAAGSGGIQFPSSISSASVDPVTGGYKLAFLAAGVYDLVVTATQADSSLGVSGFVTDVAVQEGQTTTQPIDMLALASAP